MFIIFRIEDQAILLWWILLASVSSGKFYWICFLLAKGFLGLYPHLNSLSFRDIVITQR